MAGCVVCGRQFPASGLLTCRSCRKPCEPDDPKILLAAEASHVLVDPVPLLVDVKSACCHADVDVLQQVTCSDTCHEIYVLELMRRFGATKRIIDAASGKAYLVPTRTLIEKGIRHEDLHNFPEAPP